MPLACRSVSGQGCWSLLVAANADQIPLLGRLVRASADQSAFQLCVIKETISSCDYTVWFERWYRGDMFVCATSRNSWPFDTLALFCSPLVITYLAYNVPIFWSPEICYNKVIMYYITCHVHPWPSDTMLTSMKSHRARDVVTLLQTEMPSS